MSTLYEGSTRDGEWLSIYDHPELAPLKNIEVDGYRTSYIESGRCDAPPLVLVHGGNFQIGMGVDRWYPTILALARHFRVFAVDELGGGESDAPRNLADIGDVRVRAEHVLKFIEKLDVDPIHVLGQSQGAWIAAYVAIKRPDLVNKVVLVDCASMALPEGGMGGPNIGKSFSESFLPGTMVKRAVQPTPESIRDYFSTMVHDQSMLCDPFVRRAVALAEKWLPVWDKPWQEFWADGGQRNRLQYMVSRPRPHPRIFIVSEVVAITRTDYISLTHF